MTDADVTQTPPQLSENGDIDKEVAEILTDMIALLCNAQDAEVKVNPVCGDKSAMFVVDFDSPSKARYRGMFIGREGRTIRTIRQYLQIVGGAYRRYYDIDLAEDRSRKRPQRP
jgi:predicted RNA-binding protein YlqC (UPF0109 family)